MILMTTRVHCLVDELFTKILGNTLDFIIVETPHAMYSKAHASKLKKWVKEASGSLLTPSLPSY